MPYIHENNTSTSKYFEPELPYLTVYLFFAIATMLALYDSQSFMGKCLKILHTGINHAKVQGDEGELY